MDFYQQYGVCCTFYLAYPYDYVRRYKDKRLQYIGDIEEYVCGRFSRRFYFHKSTEEIYFLKFDEVPDLETDDRVYIDNLMDEIDELYTNRNTTDFANSEKYVAIAKYFETLLINVCKENNIRLNELYPIFVVPDEWKIEKSDIIQRIMIPILTKAVGGSNRDNRDHVLFMGGLETKMASLQLTGGCLPFIHNENRCIMYTLYGNSKKVSLKARCFQVKEDYNMRLFKEKYYSLNILSTADISVYVNDKHKEMRHILLEFIFKKLLKLDHPITTPVENGYQSVADSILDDVIDSFVKTLKGKRPPFDLHSTTKAYLDEYQIKFLQSTSFHEYILKPLYKSLLSNKLEQVLDFVKEQNKHVPFIRRSIIFSSNVDTAEEVTNIYILLLKEGMRQLYEQIGNLDWHFLNNFHANYSGGAFLTAARRAMVSNISQSPIIVEQHEKQNTLGLPYFYPIRQMTINSNKPELIVYIEISVHSTLILCEVIDFRGHIKQQIDIGVDDSTTFSITTTKLRNKPFDGLRKKDTFIEFLKKLLDKINSKLKGVELVRFVLCLEKSIMNACDIGSRLDLLKLIRESKILGFKKKPRGITAVDQGERTVWESLQRVTLEPPSYYVHAHMADDYIYLKLHQIVDTTESNNGVPESAPLFIKDTNINMENTYQQAGEMVWRHIQSLDEEERTNFIYYKTDYSIDNISNYTIFKDNFTEFIKYKLFLVQDDIQSYADLYAHKHQIQISNTHGVSISIQEILEIAIIPLLKQSVLSIIACLLDEFGYFEIARLFVTGGFMKIQSYSRLYDHIIMTEMKKEFKRLIREKTHRTKFELLIDTSNKQSTNATKTLGCRHFCHNAFTKGDLRAVASTTYLISGETRKSGYSLYTTLDCLSQFSDKRYGLFIRGEELRDKRIMMDLHIADDRKIRWTDIHMFLEELSEPKNMKEILDDNEFKKTKTARYKVNEPYLNINRYFDLLIIQVKALHHLACIELTVERYYRDALNDTPKLGIDYSSHLIGERLTLKYFE